MTKTSARAPTAIFRYEPMAPKYEAGSRLILHNKYRANVTRHIIKHGLDKDSMMRDKLKQTLITNKPAN